MTNHQGEITINIIIIIINLKINEKHVYLICDDKVVIYLPKQKSHKCNK